MWPASPAKLSAIAPRWISHPHSSTAMCKAFPPVGGQRACAARPGDEHCEAQVVVAFLLSLQRLEQMRDPGNGVRQFGVVP